MMDAIDELVAHATEGRELQPKQRRQLRAFHEFHKANPEVLDFLVTEIRLRLAKGFPAFSYNSLWNYARWKLEMPTLPGATFKMNDHAGTFYSRAITILHPEFNGLCEFRGDKLNPGQSIADICFGTRIEQVTDKRKRPKGYARKLQWEDGTTLENGWRPSVAHEVKHAAKRKPDIH